MSTENTHFGADKIREFLRGKSNLFFIGIGGASMSSLAHMSKSRGFNVTGYDRTPSALTKTLEQSGIAVYYEPDTDNVKNADAVIYTVAIPADNPEYVYAQAHAIPCISRADYLGYLMSRYKRRIGISGMHGKSTTTALTAKIFLEEDGADPTIITGAKLREFGEAYRVGGDEYFIFEACEYKDSFLDFYPTTAVVLNIEMDHVDYFNSIEQIENSFAAFEERTGKDGCAILNCDDDHVMKSAQSYDGKIVTFGVKNADADYTATNISFVKGRANFDIQHKGNHLCSATMTVPGEHLIHDSLAAAAAANESGISPTAIERGLCNFSGIERRMEWRGKVNGADIYDDYAHHPTAIRTTLNGVKEMGYDHVICIFQPHTYSRTADLYNEFAQSLKIADVTILSDIYAAREINVTGVSSEALAKEIPGALYFDSFEKIAAYIKSTARENDVVIIAGAGDITELANMLI